MNTYANCDTGECRFGVLGAGGVHLKVRRRNGVLSAAQVLTKFRYSFIDAAWNVISAICHRTPTIDNQPYTNLLLNSLVI